MRAILLQQPAPAEQSPLHLTDLSDPTPAPDEVRVRIHTCGLCHTDLHTIEGDLPLPKLPLVPGCQNARFTGYHVHGGYAELCVVREDFTHPLPPAFSDEDAAPLLCAGVIGYRSYRLSGAQSGQRLGLYGFGASAHLVLQLARYQKCEVYVFTRSRTHRDLAETLGAVWTGSAEDTPPHPLDASIIFAPAGSLVPLALKHLRKAGTLALAGITMSQIPALDYELLYHERIVRSVANSTREDCREFLRLAAEIPIQTEVRVYPLTDANRALQDLKHSHLTAAGVLQIA